MPAIDQMFTQMVQMGASDLHLTSGCPPHVRESGEMKVMAGQMQPLPPQQINELLMEIAPKDNWQQFTEEGDTDFAYEIKGLARFRANYFMDRTGPGAVFRVIPVKIVTVEELKLPKSVVDLCYLSKGLVVVTGPTGSGKSTTLAAMIDHVNTVRQEHIITIEDPVEFVHSNKGCLINQREVHKHTQSFKRALRAALREDPDVVLVGEMRDLETVEIALETAETGHLVFGTLHTTTAASTVDRIIDQFPTNQQAQVRTMLASTLKGVVAQTLCRKIPKGRVAALEVLIVNSAIANYIREGKTYQIPSAMQTGAAEGMRLLNDNLFDLVKAKAVDSTEAYIKSVDKQGLLQKFTQAGIKVNLPSGNGKNQPTATPMGPGAGAK